jgi:tetratricopeptide (TPR) repeat protein
LFARNLKSAMESEFFTEGQEKARAKDYQGAIASFDQALAIAPDFAEGYYHRGLAKFDLGNHGGAIADYTQAIQLDSQNINGYFARSLGYMALGELAAAIADTETMIRLNPNAAKAYKLQATIETKLGQTEAAIANLKRAAELYLEQKDSVNCRNCLDKIKQLQPAKITPVVPEKKPVVLPPMLSEKELYAQMLEKAESGDCQGALSELNWAIKADANDAQAYRCRGIVRCKLKNYRLAIADFNQALKLAPEDITTYRNRGKARAGFGDHRGAIADYNKVLESQPEDCLTYIARGNAYREIGNYPGAIQDYSKAIKINPQAADAYYNRAIAKTRQEEMKAAIDDYQTAAQMFCEQEDWDNYQKAIDSLKTIQAQVPSETTPKLNNQQLRQRLLRLVGGYWEIAERLIDQAKAKYPGRTEQWYWETVIANLERDRGL